MYRIPADFDWSVLEGLEVIQVCIDQFNLLLQLHPKGSINLQCEWSLRDSAGIGIDRHIEHSERKSWRVHCLLAKKITKCIRASERVLIFEFEGGFVLTIEDDSDQYESFSIQVGEHSIYV